MVAGPVEAEDQVEVAKPLRRYRVALLFQTPVAGRQGRWRRMVPPVVAGQTRPSNISARLWEAQREAARSQMEELGEQVEAYERLHAGRSKGVVLEGVEDLPKALIRARIAAE